jgi:hypothetical protein
MLVPFHDRHAGGQGYRHFAHTLERAQSALHIGSAGGTSHTDNRDISLHGQFFSGFSGLYGDSVDSGAKLQKNNRIACVLAKKSLSLHGKQLYL